MEIKITNCADISYIMRNNAQGQPFRYGDLATDEDTGMYIRYQTYFAGTMTPEHTHPCAHAIYVLSGTLRTNGGDFGPGTCAWYPEGVSAFHGATPNEDLVCLFITNKPFDITYKDPQFNLNHIKNLQELEKIKQK